MPLYDGDLETQEGIPETAQRFKDVMISHQGLLIASPEYNSSISGVLKNAIDWASRLAQGEPFLAAFANKAAAIMSASPGSLGGLRGLGSLRSILENIKVLVLPDQVAVGRAHEVFNEDGSLNDPKQRELVEELGTKLARVMIKLSS